MKRIIVHPAVSTSVSASVGILFKPVQLYMSFTLEEVLSEIPLFLIQHPVLYTYVCNVHKLYTQQLEGHVPVTFLLSLFSARFDLYMLNQSKNWMSLFQKIEHHHHPTFLIIFQLFRWLRFTRFFII